MALILKTNTGYEIKVNEPELIVKDDKLYNKKTKSFEALEGDKICFVKNLENGYKVTTVGSVEGYTFNGHVKLRGVKEPYEVTGYSIEHVAKIAEFIDENAVKTEIIYAD